MEPLRPSFSREAIVAGIRACLPLQVAMIPFGLVCGIVAQGQGLSLIEITLMSGIVYAGSAQLLALGQWTHPPHLLTVTLTALVVNLRLTLMGPVVGPWLDRIRGWRLVVTLFLMADQNWAMSVKEIQARRWDAGYLFGTGIVMWVTWVAATAAGHVMGASVKPPPGHPLFFAATAVFVCMIASLWRGRRDILPWVVAAGISVLVARLVDGTWYILAGAISGAAYGVIRDRRA